MPKFFTISSVGEEAISCKEKLLASVLAKDYAKFKENHPILNFQAMCHTTRQVYHMIHTFHTETAHWWLHRETREMACVYRQQNVTSFNGTGLDGAEDPLDTPILSR